MSMLLLSVPVYFAAAELYFGEVQICEAVSGSSPAFMPWPRYLLISS